ncbi:MAG: HAD family hydrolase [Novosphingobium sp.]|nr:HAD family hydrolase [Novosphingobium sp.]
MSRPLLVSDCDEVLLHMIVHFREWLGEAHDIEFRLEGHDFATAMRHRADGRPVALEDIWPLLNGFFDKEMHRQTPIEGAVQALNALAEDADVVILTNLSDHRQDDRVRQLAGHGIHARVFTNQGPKGPALRAIVEEYNPSRTVFIDDLAQHHESVAGEVPGVVRLHMVGEPTVAPHIPCAHERGHAHARIDRWEEALPWLREKLHGTGS